MPVTARAANFVRGYAEIGGQRLHYVETGARVELSIAALLVAYASAALTLCQRARSLWRQGHLVPFLGLPHRQRQARRGPAAGLPRPVRGREAHGHRACA